MTYCSASDVRLIVNTALTDIQIDTLIVMSDAEIDRKLGTQSASDKLIGKLSMLLTARAIRSRDPSSFAIGEYSETIGSMIAAWDSEIECIEALYRRSMRRV